MIIIGNAQFQATVSQGLNQDSLKLLRHSQFSGFQPSLPISFLTPRAFP